MLTTILVSILTVVLILAILVIALVGSVAAEFVSFLLGGGIFLVLGIYGGMKLYKKWLNS